MFDMMKIAKNIKEVRIAQNMTQMNLADAIEVSCQAVSNWERGNSMPDIAKLEPLCRILQISLDQLLGTEKEYETVTKIISADERSAAALTIEGLKELAPYLPPREIKKLLNLNEKSLDCSVLTSLAPFLNQEDLDELTSRLEGEMSSEALISLAPFLSRTGLNKLTLYVTETASMETIIGLAPFLSEDEIDNLLQHYTGVPQWEHIMSLAPFLGRDSLHSLLTKTRDKESITPPQAAGHEI